MVKLVWLLEQQFGRVGRFKIRARHMSRVGWRQVRSHRVASPRRAHGRVCARCHARLCACCRAWPAMAVFGLAMARLLLARRAESLLLPPAPKSKPSVVGFY